MVSMMLVAGNSSKSLADFFEKRGTFTVTNVYPNLAENIGEIQSQIIKVDKLLYLFNKDAENGADVRTEMRLLGKLLKDSSFFNPAEIIFMLKASENAETAIKYFKTVVEDANFDNYTVKVIEGKLTYEVVYSSVMGISQVRDFENTYRSIYKVSRDSTAELAYAAQDNEDMVVQLADNYRMKGYEEHRDLLLRTTSGEDIPFAIKERESANVKIPSAGIGEMEEGVEVVVVTGAGKSGKSIWATALSVSAIEAGKKVCVIDLTKNGDLEQFLSRTSVGCSTCTFREYVEGAGAGLTLCRPKGVERGVAFSFINYVLEDAWDLVFIVTELEEYGKLKCLSTSVAKTILMTTPREVDVKRVAGVETWGELCVILNDVTPVFAEDELLDARGVRKYFGDECKIVGSKKFTSLDVDSTYYKGVIR